MFLSHKLSVLENTYKVLDQFQRQKVLVNDKGTYKLISNICLHQQSLISQSDGTGNRVCPYHNWSFTIDGSPITSGRTEHYCKNSTPLNVDTVYEWNSLLFDCPVNHEIDIDFRDMVLMEKRIDYVKASRENIMDLFLDVDHIQTVHAGVYDMIDINNTNVDWKYYSNGSVQTVNEGARWIAIYPGTMIEWQKGALFITVAIPFEKHSNVHVFKYMDKNFSNTWKLNEYVWETAWSQDKAQAELLTTFADKNLEPQKIHYRSFLKTNGIN